MPRDVRPGSARLDDKTGSDSRVKKSRKETSNGKGTRTVNEAVTAASGLKANPAKPYVKGEFVSVASVEQLNNHTIGRGIQAAG